MIVNDISIVIGSWGSYNDCNERALGSKWLNLSEYSEWEDIEKELENEGFELDGIDEELFIQDKVKRKELYDKFALVAEKYLPLQKCENSVYLVLIAKSPAELVEEGASLHHCVGSYGYDQKFIREETLIFFIRDAAKPSVPLVTVEYSLRTKKILQCYADHNQTPSQEITDYVHKKWLPYAKRQLKKIAA